MKILIGLALIAATFGPGAPCFGAGDAGYRSWQRSEQLDNHPQFRKSTADVRLRLSIADPENYTVVSLEGDHRFRNFIMRPNGILGFTHPFNTDTSVPFYGLPEIPEELYGQLTASASITVELDGKPYSIKIPTDRPFGPKLPGESDEQDLLASYMPIYGRYQPHKANRAADIAAGMNRSKHILKIDRELGEPSDFGVLKEILSVVDKRTGNGYMVRDLSPLRDGHFYISAHSLPIIGESLALKNGIHVTEFVSQFYVEETARVMARMLVRYQLTLENVNPQNVLIQMDANFRPTGKIYLRDLSDTEYAEPLTAIAGALAQENEELRLSNKIFVSHGLLLMFGPLLKKLAMERAAVLYPDGYESYELEEVGKAIGREFHARFVRAYVDELQKLLGVSLAALDTSTPSSLDKSLRAFLKSPVGQFAVRRYLQTLKAARMSQSCFGALKENPPL